MRSTLHADDLGATATVNNNILATWKAGSLDSVSIIANGDAVEAAAAAVNYDPERPLRLIVHLNLSEGRPLASPTYSQLLTNSSGEFHLGFIGLWRLWQTLGASEREQLRQQVELEFSAQIEKTVSTFEPRSVSGVDGHIHIQMLPFLFPVAASVARQYNLKEIRISQEVFHFSLRDSLRFGYLPNIAKHFLLNYLSRQARHIASANKLTSPDSVAGVLYSGQMTRRSARAAANAARRKGQNWLELIFHPGKAADSEMLRWRNQKSIGAFYLSTNREKERDELICLAEQQGTRPDL